MAGYRPDDDWSQTNEKGETIRGGWKIIVAFMGVLIAALLIGVLGHVSIWPFVATGIFVGLPTFCVWKIITGLRTGIVGVRFGSYSRTEHPFHYWSLMTMFAAMAAWLLGLIILVVLHRN